MPTKKYFLKPHFKTVKEGFTLEDENGNLVYDGQMTKFKLFGASPYTFTNKITNKVEEHKISKTLTTEESGMAGFFSKKSSFKIDGKNIWDYLHDEGTRIDSTFSMEKVGMTYKVTYKGKDLATIATSTPEGKSKITTDMFYEIEANEEDLDLVFLVSFSIAKTEQTFYN